MQLGEIRDRPSKIAAGKSEDGTGSQQSGFLSETTVEKAGRLTFAEDLWE